MSETPSGEGSAIIRAPETRLANTPGSLPARGLALAASLLSQPVPAPPPGELRCLRGHRDCVTGVAFSPDGRLGLSGSWDGTLRLWELESGAELHSISGHGHRVSCAAFSMDGRRLFSGGWDGTARLWEAESGAEIARFGAEGAGMVHCAALSPDGRHAAWGGSSPLLSICDLSTGAVVRECRVPVGPVRSARFSPDGSRLLSGSGQVVLTGEGRDNGTLCLWGVETGARLWGWADATEPVLSAAFSADGRRAFSSTGWPSRSRLNVTSVWDVESGRELSRYDAHRQPVFSGAFLPDGRLLLGSRDRLLRLWDPEEGRELHRLEGHADAVLSVAVSPDGGRALSGGADGTVRLWRLPAPA